MPSSFPRCCARGADVVIYGTGAAASEIPLMSLLAQRRHVAIHLCLRTDRAERAAALDAIARRLEAGKLINNVAITVPLPEIVAAHEAVEAGNVPGNVVVANPLIGDEEQMPATSAGTTSRTSKRRVTRRDRACRRSPDA